MKNTKLTNIKTIGMVNKNLVIKNLRKDDDIPIIPIPKILQLTLQINYWISNEFIKLVRVKRPSPTYYFPKKLLGCGHAISMVEHHIS